MFHVMILSPSLWTTVYTILIFDSATENMTSQLTNTATENVTPLLRNTIYRENKTEEYQVSNTEFVNYSILHWPNYSWFAAGLGIGILLMLIINSNLYCQVWCPNFRILKRIRILILWHRFIIWYRDICLGRNEYFVSTPEQNNRIITKQDKTDLQLFSRASLSPRLTNQPRSLQESQLSLHPSQRSQLSCGSRLLQLSNLTNQSQSSSQWNIKLSTVSRQSHIIQPLPSPSSFDSNRLLVSTVRDNPATIGDSRIAALIRTTAVTTMIAKSTTVPRLLTSFSTQFPATHTNPQESIV